ncbi:cytochrome P450 [Artomyces pyxidatus]|uniref:Cytochrome P450 n=1 Tax=Artomyces pyxidatus TaxID=48021 RepID=A0ACB8SSJ9_9AGAM|nr:cytochrome P450 [Artomyces pyxidatus]
MLVAITYALCTILVVFYASARLRMYRRNPKGLRYPPGPRPHFLLGNIRDLPTGGHEWIALEEMSKKYNSDVIHFQVVSSHVVVLNSLQVASDLLDKKSMIYSDRPRLPYAKELIGWSWSMVVMCYHEGFSAHRRIVQQSFQPSVVTSLHRPVMQSEVDKLLKNLLASPDDFADHLRSMAGAIVMMITYGYQVAPKDDPYVRLSEDVHNSGDRRMPVAHVVDLFPILRYAPARLFEFKRRALAARKLVYKMRNAPFQMVKERLAAGTALPSMATSLLEKGVVADGIESEALIKNCTAIIYGAGVDTTSAALTNFFLAMIMYPEVQERAQRELDAVVGKDRLPEFGDRPRLPYLACIIKEVLRWRATSALGIPHCTTTDDVYRGMFIPKGTTVIANLSAMLHDESVYPEPEVFNPDRFARGAGGSEGAPDPARVAFGFGRRICPGRFFADDVVWLAVVNILHIFKLEKKIGSDRRVLEPDVKWSSGPVSVPSSFGCKITLRLAGGESLIPSLE